LAVARQQPDPAPQILEEPRDYFPVLALELRHRGGCLSKRLGRHAGRAARELGHVGLFELPAIGERPQSLDALAQLLAGDEPAVVGVQGVPQHLR
jgi:hypothetical protein